jgi:hypothetical protein
MDQGVGRQPAHFAVSVKTLLPLLLAGLLGACSSGEGDDALYHSQKQAIDKAREAERLLQERAESTRKRLDGL